MDNLRSILRAVRNFLFSSANREFLIFFAFLVLSGIFWLLMTLNENYEREFVIPVRISNVPKNVVLTSDETDTVKITLSDKGLVLVGYMYGEGIRPLSVSFKNYAKQNGSGTITAAELQKMMLHQLSASTGITSIKPDKMEFFFNYGLNKKVPVRYSGHVDPEDPYFLSNVAYSPDSVTIYASQEKLDSLNVVYTEPLNLTDFRDTTSVTCNLQKMKGVKIVPGEVKVSFFTDVLTEESVDDVPIVGVNMPPGKVLRTFPSKVSVSFVTGVSQFKRLSAKHFKVVVDYNEIASHPSDKCKLYLKSVPHGISRPSLSLQQVDYLIEEE